ncbi:MAG TPA: amidohydrolase family protein [Candidatus Binataceae bacterium]|nr:amidohydrolase family protein [Candidatus Binataceae bacterium]
MTKRILRDADSHIMELADFLTAYADPSIRDRMPPILPVGRLDSTLVGLPTGGRRCHPAETVAEMKTLGDRLLRGPKWYAALGAFNCEERGAVLDLLGIERQVIFSSFASGQLFGQQDPAVRYGGVRAFNRAMQTFVADDSRLHGVGVLVFDDPARTAVELDRALSEGLRLFMLPSDVTRSPGHRDHDRIWARLAEARASFVLHVGSSKLSIEPEWMDDGMNRKTARGGAEVVGSKDMTSIFHSAERFLSVLILDGVLDRFPALRGGCIELGAGWVPSMRRRLDHIVDVWSKPEPHLREMKRRPSEQMDDQLRFTPYPFEDVGELIRQSSDRLYLFSTDYPHAEGGRDPIGRFEASLGEHPESVKEKFFSANFCDLVQEGARN